MKIAVIGTGYVGLVTGVCLAEVGHHVVGVDTNEEKIKKLLDGISPIYEPGLDGLLVRNKEHERLEFTTNLKIALKGAKAAFIAVGTPPGEDGSADLKYVKAVAKSIGELAENDMLVIVKSTVPVGTCDIVQGVIDEALSKRGSKLKLPVASNPEFLKEGSAIEDFMHPDRIIAGIVNEESREILLEMYKPFVTDDPNKILFMDRYSSELTKYGANAMLATRISFMNELSRLCEKVGANIDFVRLGMGSDPRIGRKFLYAGPGYGGSCFPKDVSALIKSGAAHGVELEVLNAVENANAKQKKWVSEKIKSRLGSLNGKRVALWGLAFKPGTDDVRESPAKTIVEELVAGGVTVVGHDPEGATNFASEVSSKLFTLAESPYDALEGADALVLVTEWREYKRPNWEKVKTLMRSPVVFDFRNQYEPKDLRSIGFAYECIGRPKL